MGELGKQVAVLGGSRDGAARSADDVPGQGAEAPAGDRAVWVGLDDGMAGGGSDVGVEPVQQHTDVLVDAVDGAAARGGQPVR
jgi:hypothetical protein